MKKVIGLLGLFFLLTSCSEDKALDPDDIVDEFQLKGSMAGQVIDDDGVPIIGAAATLDSAGYDSQTDTNGQYTIPDIPEGSYSITFTHAFHADTTIDGIEILEDQDLVIQNVIMRKLNPNELLEYGYITGVVIDSATGQSVGGIDVASSQGPSTVTNQEGVFVLSQLVEGKHEITLSNSQFINLTLDSINITSKDTVHLDTIALVEKDDGLNGILQGVAYYEPNPRGVEVRLVPRDGKGSPQDALTDAQGDFEFINLPTGWYYIQVTGGHSSDLDSVEIFPDSVTQIELKNIKAQNQIFRNISGALNDLSDFKFVDMKKIEVEILEDGQLVPDVFTLSFLPVSQQYSGQIEVSSDASLWNATIKIYDQEDKVISYAVQSFDKLSGDIVFPSIELGNAVPRIVVNWSSPKLTRDTLSILDTLWMPISILPGVDDTGDHIAEWKLKSEVDWIDFDDQDYVVMPDTPTLDFTVEYRVIDDGGSERNRYHDFYIVEDVPKVTLSLSDTSILTNQDITVTIEATDNFSDELIYEISQDGVNYSQAEVTNLSWSAAGDYVVYGRVTDDDGNQVIDSVEVEVLEVGLSTFTDSRDAQVYSYTPIGSQVWMSENLAYNPGDTSLVKCYDDVTANCNSYGAMYSLKTLLNLDNPASMSADESTTIQGVCPVGWHIPSKSEWDILFNYINTQESSTQEAAYLKANSSIWQKNFGTPYEDTYGMRIMPYGGYFRDEQRDEFSGYSIDLVLWTRTKESSTEFSAIVFSDNSDLHLDFEYEDGFHYLRCIRD